MHALPRISLLLLFVAAQVNVFGAEQPFDPADLLNPPTTEPAAPEAPAQAKKPVPSAESLKEATDRIRNLYKTEYNSAKGRAALVTTLFDLALQTNDDSTSRYALLSEARELAIQSKNVFFVLEVCDQVAAGFAGESADALKRIALGRINGSSVVPHLLKLFDAPDDAFANSTVGRWYASDVQQWDRALPLLIKGSDQTLASAARAELALTSTAQISEQLAVADLWYDIGKRTTGAKESFWRHALGFYELAKTGATGLNLSIIDKRINEIEAYLPIGPETDYNRLSAGQWEKLTGKTFTVDASKGVNHTSVILKEGEKVRVVPHPTDTWKITQRGEVFTTNWKGGGGRRSAMVSLQCRVGDGQKQKLGIITGTGKLSLFVFTPFGVFDPDSQSRRVSRLIEVTGTVRVKILPVTE